MHFESGASSLWGGTDERLDGESERTHTHTAICSEKKHTIQETPAPLASR